MHSRIVRSVVTALTLVGGGGEPFRGCRPTVAAPLWAQVVDVGPGVLRESDHYARLAALGVVREISAIRCPAIRRAG